MTIKTHIQNASLFNKSWVILALVLLPIQVLAQRSHFVGVYGSLFEEFSFDPRISKTLIPLFADIGTYQDSDDPTKTWRTSPLTVGLSYNTFNAKGKGFGSSFNYYFASTGSIGVRGGSLRNEHVILAASIYQVLKATPKGRIELTGYLRPTFRYGKDTYWINYGGFPLADLFPYRRLFDFGLGGGMMLNCHLPLGFTMFAELGLTQWVFLYSNIFDREGLNYGYYPLKPWHQLDFRAGLGYTINDLSADSKK